MLPNYAPPGYAPPGYAPPGYPPPGYAPPGYGPAGYVPQPPIEHRAPGDRRLDKLAVWSLVTGIVGALLLSIPFGIVGLVRTRGKERRGRGFAIAGLALSLAWIMVIVGVTAFEQGRRPQRAADGTVLHQGSIPPTALRNGDCVKVPAVTVGQTQTFDALTVVPCSTPHNGQVFTTVQSTDATYPGLSELAQQGLRDCREPAQAYLGTSATSLLLLAFVPSQTVWDSGNRDEHCLLVDAVQDITGDIRTHA
ncbi:MAG: DUF4190 domain-containing protein [Jatrophihabitantaceae bacterium]